MKPSPTRSRPLFALLVLLWLTGCATTPPSSFYVLTPLAQAERRDVTLAEGRVTVGIGPVSFPDFLDRPQIVTRAGSNRLDLDELNRWGGSLQDGFLRTLGENLAHLLGTAQILVYPAEVRFPVDYRVIATVLRFEGAKGGEAVLKVRWAVIDPYSERPLAVRESTYRNRVAAPGEEGLVAALSASLGDFSRDVATTLRQLPKPQPPRLGLEPI
jgi:uncharacterized lipoprotein YmbA